MKKAGYSCSEAGKAGYWLTQLNGALVHSGIWPATEAAAQGSRPAEASSE